VCLDLATRTVQNINNQQAVFVATEGSFMLRAEWLKLHHSGS
jgi:hypothetical protein